MKFKAQQKSKKPKPFAVNMLKDSSVAEEFLLQLHNRFKLFQNVEDVEAHWGSFKASVHETAMKVLGRRRGTNRERLISDKTWEVIDNRKNVKWLRETAPQQEYESISEQCKKLDREMKKGAKATRNNRLKAKGLRHKRLQIEETTELYIG